MFIYTLLMLLSSAFTLMMVPRALKDLGREQQRLEAELPGVSFDRMLEAGYRLNTFLLLLEIFYYYLLVRYAGSVWQLFYGGFAFGLIHIVYLIFARLEKWRLSRRARPSRASRLMMWLTAILTTAEIVFLLWAAYLVLQPKPSPLSLV